MSPEVSQGVLQDILLLSLLALAIGLVVYQTIQATTSTAWSAEGNVLSRPYGLPDGIVGILLTGFFSWLILAMGTAQPPENLVPRDYAIGLFFNSLFLMMVAMVVIVYMAVLRGMNPAEMFGLRSMKWPTALGAAILWLVGVVVVMGIAFSLIVEFVFHGQWIDESEQDVVGTFRMMDSIGLRTLMAASAVLIAPVTEEIIFRGYLYGVTKRYTDRWFAMVLTSLFFASIHGHVGSFIPLFLLAIGFAIAYETTGCLWVPIFMHMLFNGSNVLRMWLS